MTKSVGLLPTAACVALLVSTAIPSASADVVPILLKGRIALTTVCYPGPVPCEPPTCYADALLTITPTLGDAVTIVPVLQYDIADQPCGPVGADVAQGTGNASTGWSGTSLWYAPLPGGNQIGDAAPYAITPTSADQYHLSITYDVDGQTATGDFVRIA